MTEVTTSSIDVCLMSQEDKDDGFDTTTMTIITSTNTNNDHNYQNQQQINETQQQPTTPTIQSVEFSKQRNLLLDTMNTKLTSIFGKLANTNEKIVGMKQKQQKYRLNSRFDSIGLNEKIPSNNNDIVGSSNNCTIRRMERYIDTEQEFQESLCDLWNESIQISQQIVNSNSSDPGC